MMEFTYDGMVRYGFGFYNPNHAAALICALMPFLWAAWCRWKYGMVRLAIGGLALLLCIALALTFSRTGVAVLLFEVVLFALVSNRHHRDLRKSPRGRGVSAEPESPRLNWQMGLGFLGICLIVFALNGVFSRFVLDKAIMNRIDIWEAGLALVASNLWQGVGLGHSGTLATSYLLRDGIACRTLVNSHLTLLAECGAVVGVIWFGVIGMALVFGRRYPAGYVSFVGLCISAFSASVFDWDLLMDFDDFGSLPITNFGLSWGLFLYFLFGGLILGSGGWRRSRQLLAVWFSSAAFVWGLALCGGSAPIVERGYIQVGREGNRSLVLRGDSVGIKEAAKFLQTHGYDAYAMPMDVVDWGQGDTHAPYSRAILFGEAHEFAVRLPELPLVYVSPPEWADFPERTEKLFLKRFADSDTIAVNAGMKPVEYY